MIAHRHTHTHTFSDWRIQTPEPLKISNRKLQNTLQYDAVYHNTTQYNKTQQSTTEYNTMRTTLLM